LLMPPAIAERPRGRDAPHPSRHGTLGDAVLDAGQLRVPLRWNAADG